MNIREELLKDHTMTQAKKIAGYAILSTKNFQELMECYVHQNDRISQRAACSLSHAAEKKPEYIQPYIETLVKKLSRKEVNNSIIRNSLRILQHMNIPLKLHGELMNTCFDFIQNPKAPAAFKALSLTILNNLSQHYPEIKPELQLIIRERWAFKTPAFKARAKKII